MRTLSTILFIVFTIHVSAQIQTVHVYVALCDNLYQGIVPVNEKLGDGRNLRTNLYWGAGYGVKNFFKVKTKEWVFLNSYPSKDSIILERLLFKHRSKDVYMLADAYDGQWIKPCTERFLLASNQQRSLRLDYEGIELCFEGESDLVAYVGHDGLMDFNVDLNYKPIDRDSTDVVILACASEDFYLSELYSAQARPLLLTTSLMAPEAYTLEAALNTWVTPEEESIVESAARAYSTYQKCSYNWALTLFTDGGVSQD